MARRERELIDLEKKHIVPRCKANEHDLLVIGMDGGRVQTTVKNEDGTRWREDKVVTVTSYVSGTKTQGGEPQKLVNSHLATMQTVEKFGRLARLEAERRGIRQAQQVLVMGDGATWIDGVADQHFPSAERVVDWYHAVEHLNEAAKAAYPQDEPQAGRVADGWETMLWEGRFNELLSGLTKQAARAGVPPKNAPDNDPRQVLRKAVNYFAQRRDRMDYPRYRKNGWPIGSGVAESGVKLYNKRVKGTEQFWNLDGAESILQLRSEWLNDPSELHHRLWPAPQRKAA